MFAQLVNVLYSVVDRIYVGNIPDVGDIALAGVGICGPIVTLLTAFGYLVGAGGAPLMGIFMGQGSKHAASQVLSNGFLMLVCISAAVSILVMGFSSQLLWWFGASEATFPYAQRYFTVYLLGTVFSALSIGMNQFIIGQGFSREGMFSVLIGAISNIILDPIFIFVFGMGVTGAALATVLSQAASCAYVLCFLRKKTTPIRLTFCGCRLETVWQITRLGLTPFFVMAFDNVLVIALNTVLQRFGGPRGDQLLTCATIVQSFMLFVTMPMYGITNGTAPILSYNYGARRLSRIIRAQKTILRFAVLFAAVMLLLAHTVCPYFVGLFTKDEEIITLTVWAIQVYTSGIIPLSLCYVVVDGLTAMGIASGAACLSIFRKSMFLISVFLLPRFFHAESAFFAEVISDVSGAVLCALAYVVIFRSISRRLSPPRQCV